MLKILSSLLLLTALGGCSLSPKSDDYSNQQPLFDLYNFFDGKVTAWGIVQNRKGEVTQRFVVDIDGSVENDVLTLDERFNYLQGEGMKQRIWRINKRPGQAFSGEASDIVNQAEGIVQGNSLNWRYQMDLAVNNGTFRVTFDDWMWMIDQKTLVNRAYIKKWGLVFGEVTLFMQKAS